MCHMVYFNNDGLRRPPRRRSAGRSKALDGGEGSHGPSRHPLRGPCLGSGGGAAHGRGPLRAACPEALLFVGVRGGGGRAVRGGPACAARRQHGGRVRGGAAPCPPCRRMASGCARAVLPDGPLCAGGRLPHGEGPASGFAPSRARTGTGDRSGSCRRDAGGGLSGRRRLLRPGEALVRALCQRLTRLVLSHVAPGRGRRCLDRASGTTASCARCGACGRRCGRVRCRFFGARDRPVGPLGLHCVDRRRPPGASSRPSLRS